MRVIRFAIDKAGAGPGLRVWQSQTRCTHAQQMFGRAGARARLPLSTLPTTATRTSTGPSPSSQTTLRTSTCPTAPRGPAGRISVAVAERAAAAAEMSARTPSPLLAGPSPSQSLVGSSSHRVSPPPSRRRWFSSFTRSSWRSFEAVGGEIGCGEQL